MLKSPKMSRNRRNLPVFDVCLTVRRRRPILYSLRRVAMAIDIDNRADVEKKEDFN